MKVEKTQMGEEIRKTLNAYIGRRVVTEELLSSICDVLRKADTKPDDDHLKFMVGETPDSVVPANLYSCLRMLYGADAPSWVECEGGSWTAPDGSAFKWKDGSLYVTPSKPARSVNITFQAAPCPETHIVSYGDTCWILEDGTTGRPTMGAGPAIKHFSTAEEAQEAIRGFVDKGFEGRFEVLPGR